MGLLVRVVEHVLVVGLLEGERLPTHRARVGGLSGVESDVLLQEIFGGESLTTVTTVPLF